MEDTLLLEAVERYLANQMNAEEKQYFEQLRKDTPEIDQLVVEHNIFLHQMDAYSDHKNIRHSLFEIHDKLLANGDINEGAEIKMQGKIVQLFHKYKRVTAIAASVGGAIALFTSIMVAYFSPIPNSELTKLGAIVHQQEKQINSLNNEVRISKMPNNVDLKGGGSSFMIDGKGYLITNAHVLNGATYANVINNAGKEYNARIAYKNDEKDLAILKIEDEDFEPIKNLPFGIRKNNADLAEEVYTLGFPNFPRTDIVYNVGYLSSVKGFNGDTVSFQIQMNANHGNSGGPIFNKRGEVVGVLSTKQQKADGVSFAIKSKNIYQIVDELKKSDSTSATIKINPGTSISGDTRENQVKHIEEFVYMVKAYRK